MKIWSGIDIWVKMVTIPKTNTILNKCTSCKNGHLRVIATKNTVGYECDNPNCEHGYKQGSETLEDALKILKEEEEEQNKNE